ncbi:MAG: hypothetical protein O7D29_01205 [Gemmatimonadetes bacterium]|nr:hypothetical protein [Gemmatimonadota bacterium]
MTEYVVGEHRRKHVLKASVTMVGLSVLLFWLPIIGPFIAGYFGGRKAGGVGPAVIAVFLPSLVLGAITILLGWLLTAIPIVGGLFGLAKGLVSAMQIAPLLIGAVIGGLQRE